MRVLLSCIPIPVQMESKKSVDEVFTTVSETLEIAKDLVRSVADITNSLTADVVTKEKTDEHEAQEADEEHVPDDEKITLYDQQIMILVSENNVKQFVSQESDVYDAGTIVAIELDEGLDPGSQLIPFLESIVPYFPSLRRVVIDVSIANDSVRDIAHLFRTKCPDVWSFSFRHRLQLQ